MSDVIKLAREANVSIRGHYDEAGATPAELERFAQLIRDDYRQELLAGSGEPVFVEGTSKIGKPIGWKPADLSSFV